MDIWSLIGLGAAAGAGAGLLAGLIGIGGGIVVVPVVYYGLLSSGVPPDEAVHVAVATSLAQLSQLAAQNCSKRLIFRSERSQGRHHKVAGHADCGTPAAITLGRGWVGKLNCKRWSRMAWSSSGSV